MEERFSTKFIGKHVKSMMKAWNITTLKHMTKLTWNIIMLIKKMVCFLLFILLLLLLLLLLSSDNSLKTTKENGKEVLAYYICLAISQVGRHRQFKSKRLWENFSTDRHNQTPFKLLLLKLLLLPERVWNKLWKCSAKISRVMSCFVWSR